MRVITWNRSFKGVSNGDAGKDDIDSEEYETHATVLDKLLAWEKKLYEEVKVGVNVHDLVYPFHYVYFFPLLRLLGCTYRVQYSDIICAEEIILSIIQTLSLV